MGEWLSATKQQEEIARQCSYARHRQK